jgi:hypothetical protein
MDLVEMVNAFIVQVVVVATDILVFFVMVRERMNAFHVEEEVISTAMTATELVS